MDNQNDPNSPNNPTPSNPWGTPPAPEPMAPAQPSPSPWTMPAQPAPEPAPVAAPEPTWTPPVQTPPQSEPIVPEPAPVTAPEPMPTFTTPPVAPAEPAAAPTSPLDNPWGAPAQAPAIDGSQTQTTTQPSWTIPTNTPSTAPAESAAPTDLSHLINSSQEIAPQPAPETLVVPSAITPSPEVSATIPPESHKGIPKWLIGLGIGLLILVVGASAYFILGVGQPAKTASLPVATTPPVRPAIPAATTIPQPTEQAVASGSAANFGNLQGGAQPATGSSTIDALRRRNQGL